MRNLFQWAKFPSGGPKDSLSDNSEYVDSFPQEPSPEVLPTTAFAPMAMTAQGFSFERYIRASAKFFGKLSISFLNQIPLFKSRS